MTASAQIYGLIREPRFEGPLDTYGKAMTVRQLVNQGRLQDMQMEQATDQARRQGRIRDLLAGGKPNVDQLMALDPKFGMEYEKYSLDKSRSEAETSKTRAEAFAKNVGIMRDLTARAQSDADMGVVREYAFRLFGPEVAAQVPARFDPEWQLKGIQTADSLIQQVRDAQSNAVTVRGQDLTAATARRGQDLTTQTALRGQDVSAATALRGQDQPVWDSDRGVFVPRPQAAAATSGPISNDAMPTPGLKATGPAAIGVANLPPSRAQIKEGDEKRKTDARIATARKKAEIVIGKVDEALKQAGYFSTGLTGEILGQYAGTGAYDLNETLQTIKANIGFQELQAMREASPTGGALGQVAVQELEALQAVLGSLKRGQSEPQLRANLQAVKRHYDGWKRAVDEAGGKSSAPGAEVEESRRIGNAEYVKINGQWYSR